MKRTVYLGQLRYLLCEKKKDKETTCQISTKMLELRNTNRTILRTRDSQVKKWYQLKLFCKGKSQNSWGKCYSYNKKVKINYIWKINKIVSVGLTFLFFKYPSNWGKFQINSLKLDWNFLFSIFIIDVVLWYLRLCIKNFKKHRVFWS